MISLKSGHLLYKNNSDTRDYEIGIAILVKRQKMINKNYSLQIIQIYAAISSLEDSDVELIYGEVSKSKTERSS